LTGRRSPAGQHGTRYERQRGHGRQDRRVLRQASPVPRRARAVRGL